MKNSKAQLCFYEDVNWNTVRLSSVADWLEGASQDSLFKN